MKDLNSLLRDADPVRHEKPVSRDTLACRRQAILGKASAGVAAGKRGRRQKFVFLAVAAVAVIAAAFLVLNLRLRLISEVHAAVKFEVVLAEDHPAPGLREAKVSGSDLSVYLHRDVVLTNSDVLRVEVVPGSSPSEFNVSVEFTPAGAQKMRSATEKNIGKRLVILIDGTAVMAPVIRETITGSSAAITGKFTKAEAERIANGIR